MLIFDPSVGRVSQFTPSQPFTPALLTFPGFDYASLQLITTSLSLSLKPVWQANDTLGDDVYIVSFGESLTPLPLSGLVFADACTFDGPTGRDGLVLFTSWWQQQNLLNRREPVSLTLGSDYAVKAFVSDLSLTVANAEDGIWKFEMLLLRIPQRALRNEELGDMDELQPQSVQQLRLGQNSGTPEPSPIITIFRTPQPPVPDDGDFDFTSDGSPASVRTIPIVGSGYSEPSRLVGPISLS